MREKQRCLYPVHGCALAGASVWAKTRNLECKTADAMKPMPVYFFSHGGGPWSWVEGMLIMGGGLTHHDKQVDMGSCEFG